MSLFDAYYLRVVLLGIVVGKLKVEAYDGEVAVCVTMDEWIMEVVAMICVYDGGWE